MKNIKNYIPDIIDFFILDFINGGVVNTDLRQKKRYIITVNIY